MKAIRVLFLIAASIILLPTAEGNSFDSWRLGFIANHTDLPPPAVEIMKMVEFSPRVVELDRKQPEFTLTLGEYLGRVVSAARVERGRRLLRENAPLLAEISRKYKVQPRFIVALWGIESNFGDHEGGFWVPSALASLAYEGRRGKYFTKELLYALQIIAEGHITPKRMRGSWAGAMGQVQFMPSTFINYAVDFDGDRKADLWGSKADALASAANYLSSIGWNNNLTWGREVRTSGLKGFKGKRKTLKEWGELGLTNPDGSPIPVLGLSAELLLPKESDGRAFLVYDNFKKILNWNRSNFFAVAVGKLSDAIKYR